MLRVQLGCERRFNIEFYGEEERKKQNWCRWPPRVQYMRGGGGKININLSVTTEGIDKPTWWVIWVAILTGASIFLFVTASELALELTQNPVKYFRDLCLGHEGDHSVLSGANFKNVLSYSALTAWPGAFLSTGISSGVSYNFLDAVWPTVSSFKQRVIVTNFITYWADFTI
jgi:hypothetical protein